MTTETTGAPPAGAADTRLPGPSLLEDPEEMRRSGYRVVDAIVDRWANLGDGPAWEGATREVTTPLLHGPPPDHGRPLDPILETVLRDVMPLAGRIDHPRFLAFIPSSPSWASVLASFLISGFNIFQGTWLESSGPSQIEVTVTGWFREWLGYPRGAGGVFTSGGSAANLIALVTAREAAGNPRAGTVYVSGQTHASAVRAARLAGISPARIRHLPVDAEFRIVPAGLRDAVARDRKDGLTPFCVIANAGTTNTGAIDPLADLARVAADEGLWYHIDAAYGGFAVLDPETKPLLSGLELSDSISLDPHKWFFQPYETGCLMVRDVTRLEAAFRMLPEYLQDAEWGPEHVNFSDRGLQLTRVFRALRVWLSVQRYGLDAHRREIARGIMLAGQAESRIRAEAELELLSPRSLGIVCFRYVGRPRVPDDRLDELNREIRDRIVHSGFAMMSSTRLHDRFSLRLCILNSRTTATDLDSVVDAILETGRGLEKGREPETGREPSA